MLLKTAGFGTSFRDAMHYLLDRAREGHEDAAILATNMGPASNPDHVIAMLEWMARQRSRIQKPVWHLIVVLREQERSVLDTARGQLLPSAVLDALQIANTGWVAVRHAEGLHILVCVVDRDGHRIATWRTPECLRDANRTVTRAFDLHAPAMPGPFPPPILSRAELEMANRDALRSGEGAPRIQLATRIVLALDPGTESPEAFAGNLARLGVDVSFHRNRHGAIDGARYSLTAYQGSMQASYAGGSINRGYAWRHIARAIEGACMDAPIRARHSEVKHALLDPSRAHDPREMAESTRPDQSRRGSDLLAAEYRAPLPAVIARAHAGRRSGAQDRGAGGDSARHAPHDRGRDQTAREPLENVPGQHPAQPPPDTRGFRRDWKRGLAKGTEDSRAVTVSWVFPRDEPSRGDTPMTDDQNWLWHDILRRTARRFRHQPYDMQMLEALTSLAAVDSQHPKLVELKRLASLPKPPPAPRDQATAIPDREQNTRQSGHVR
jgi:hypothetical protein